MILLAILIYSTFSSSALAGTPPRGKSLGNSYEIADRPLGVFDIQGRIERRTLLVEAKNEEKKTVKPTKKKIAVKTDSIKITRSAPEYETSNLPVYLRGIDRSNFKASDRVVFTPQNASIRLAGVKTGDVFRAVIEQQIKASPSVPTPVRAMILSGNLKGGIFVGEATLDRELKRVLLNFSKVRKDNKVYGIKASGLSLEGSIGLEGEYHSQAGKFFVAELASATTAGFLDATINRNQNAFGTYSQESSLQNSAKSGLVTALSKSADRFAEQARQAPEYTNVKGYQVVQVIVQDEPIEVN